MSTLPQGHAIIEQVEMMDGRVSQTVVIGDKAIEYERIVHSDEAYPETAEAKLERISELMRDWKGRVKAIGRDTGNYRQCLGELEDIVGDLE